MCYEVDIFYLLFGVFDSKNDMDDKILHDIGDSDPTEAFSLTLVWLKGCVEQNDVAEALTAAQKLQGFFDRLLQMADPNASYQVRASLTEIHRLLRVLHRDLLFWQGAKQAETRAGRHAQVLATLLSIKGFYQMLIDI
jgi:hypothetical protein